MKLRLYGWNRRVTVHNPKFQPVTNKNGHLHTEPPEAPLVFHSSSLAYGKLTNLALTGDFAVEIRLSKADLRAWISKYIQDDAPSAARFLTEMLTDALPAPDASNKAGDDGWK